MKVIWQLAELSSSVPIFTNDCGVEQIFNLIPFLFIGEQEVLKMNTEAISATNLLPLIIYFGAILTITAVMLGGAYFLGQRHCAKAADEPFESGIVPTGDVHIRFSVHFYLLAIFFCYLWGIQLITVTPPAKDELARRYPKKLALYGEDWKAPRTSSPDFLV